MNSLKPKTDYVALEIGPGRGDFLFWLATDKYGKTNPGRIAAIEYKQKRFEKLQLRLMKKEIANVRLYWGDAKKVVPERFADQSVQEIYILFSDPWPKRKHGKNRVFQDSFVQELYRILKPDGIIWVAHDDPSYVTEIKKIFLKNIAQFKFLSETSILESLMMTTTFYAEKWKRMGRQLQAFGYQKIDCSQIRDAVAMPCRLPEDPYEPT